MTIQEAIRSGKPFFRKVYGNGDRYEETLDNYPAFDEIDYKYVMGSLTVSDILATDWEIKEEGK